MGKHRKAVFVVVYSKIKNQIYYLILKRKLHWKGWEFPKGGVRKGEKILDAVKREIKEETGLKALKIKRFDVSGRYKYEKELKEREGVTGQTYSLYAGKINKRKIKLDELEHSKYKWASFRTAMKKLTWSNQKKSLKIVDDWLKNEIQRNDDKFWEKSFSRKECKK